MAPLAALAAGARARLLRRRRSARAAPGDGKPNSLRRNLSKIVTRNGSHVHEGGEGKVNQGPRNIFQIIYDWLNTTSVQAVLYLLYVFLFQFLIISLRRPAEYYMAKNMFDNVLNQPWSEWDEDQFMGVANHDDIYAFIEYALFPALQHDVWVGTKPPHFKTPGEIALSMDMFDWSAGLSLRQSRVAEAPASECGTYQTMQMYSWVAKTQFGATQDALEETPRRFGPCYPNLKSQLGIGLEEMADFGYNWTMPSEPPLIPFKYYTAAQMGSNPDGQVSAAADMQYNKVPTSGYASFLIPFLSDVLLPLEEGHFSQVTDYRNYTYRITIGAARPNYYCVRLSLNGEHVRQVCDPNDADGRTTGVVVAEMQQFFAAMSSAHWLDAQTRTVLLTLPVRANNAGMRMRLSMMFQISSNAGIIASYDIESRIDMADIDFELSQKFLYVICGLVTYFILIEALEVKHEGVVTYFTNMWNIMDWLGFVLFFLTFNAWQKLSSALEVTSCAEGAVICTGVGFHDDWEVMEATKWCKYFLAISSTLQLLKTIKFINVFVPKMALATSVLSHGLADLAMFTIFFCFTIFAFGQMFFIQLGCLSSSYVSQWESAFSLFRALFGDFDIQLILDSSPSYVNAMLFATCPCHTWSPDRPLAPPLACRAPRGRWLFLAAAVACLEPSTPAPHLIEQPWPWATRSLPLNLPWLTPGHWTMCGQVAYLFTAIFIFLSIFLTILGEHQAFVRDIQSNAKAAGQAPPDFGIFATFGNWAKNLVARCLKRNSGGKTTELAPTGAEGGAVDWATAVEHHAEKHQDPSARLDGAVVDCEAQAADSTAAAVMESNEKVAKELREVKRMLQALQLGRAGEAPAGAGAGTSAGPGSASPPPALANGPAASRSFKSGEQKTIESTAVQLSLATLRATQVARSSGTGLEASLAALHKQQEEHGAILQRLLERRGGSGGGRGHRSRHSAISQHDEEEDNASPPRARSREPSHRERSREGSSRHHAARSHTAPSSRRAQTDVGASTPRSFMS